MAWTETWNFPLITDWDYVAMPPRPLTIAWVQLQLVLVSSPAVSGKPLSNLPMAVVAPLLHCTLNDNEPESYPLEFVPPVWIRVDRLSLRGVSRVRVESSSQRSRSWIPKVLISGLEDFLPGWSSDVAQ